MSIGGLVVTDGQLAEALVAETRRIHGEQERFEGFGAGVLTAEEITSRVKEFIGDDPWIVFVDGPGTTVCRRACAAIGEGQAVVSGVNLPMLLSFLVHRDNYDVAELAERMTRDGGRSLTVISST